MVGEDGGEGKGWRRADFCEDKERDERFCLLDRFLTPHMPEQGEKNIHEYKEHLYT